MSRTYKGFKLSDTWSSPPPDPLTYVFREGSRFHAVKYLALSEVVSGSQGGRFPYIRTICGRVDPGGRWTMLEVQKTNRHSVDCAQCLRKL
jgi:hypothetical protein